MDSNFSCMFLYPQDSSTFIVPWFRENTAPFWKSSSKSLGKYEKIVFLKIANGPDICDIITLNGTLGTSLPSHHSVQLHSYECLPFPVPIDVEQCLLAWSTKT